MRGIGGGRDMICKFCIHKWEALIILRSVGVWDVIPGVRTFPVYYFILLFGTPQVRRRSPNGRAGVER